MNTLRLHTLFIVIGLLAAHAASHGQPAHHYNTAPFDSLNPRPGFFPERYSGLTGYAAPTGREYALLGGYYGTHIIDVTEKPIREVAFIQGIPDGWREIKTYGTYAYVVSEGGNGIQIIDLSELPARATLVRNDTGRFVTGHTVTRDGKYLYVNGSNIQAGANGGTLIFDLTDPEHPAYVGAYTKQYVHDCTVRNDTLYAATLATVDIVYLGADRKNPEFVTAVQYPGAGTHNCDLTADGRYILTTDEVNTTPKTLKVWDRGDVESISKVADFTPASGEIIHNVHVKGDRAYVAWYSAGTRIIDISRPDKPAELGYFDTHPGAIPTFIGNWEVYPYLPSEKILASDMERGLYVFTFNGARRGSVRGVVRDAETNDPIPGAVITMQPFGRAILANEQGRYEYAGAVDMLPFVARADLYDSLTGTLQLTEQGNEQDIVLSSPNLQCVLQAADAGTGQLLPRFVVRIMERTSHEMRPDEGEVLFRIPPDTAFRVYVAAWGYQPRIVTVQNPAGPLLVALEKGYADEAEVDLGWRYQAPGDDATEGRWERAVPAPLPSYPVITQPARDHTPDPGDHVFFTQASIPGGWPESGDVDRGRTTLTSPPMDLRGSVNPYINIALWYSRDRKFTEGVPPDDTLLVMISGDDGATWAEMERITESAVKWVMRSYRIADHVVPGERTLFRIVASDLNVPSWVEAGLDDFAVVDSAVSGVQVYDPSGAVRTAGLRPNPFSTAAAIELLLERPQDDARLELFDAGGRCVEVLHTGALTSGTHRFAIDAMKLPAGRYAWRLLLDNGSSVNGAAVLVR